MARKIVLLDTNNGFPVLLSESKAENEQQLQEMMKANPDLLPIDEFGMTGPLMVVGRETSLPSGAVDLVAVARTGELLVIEFKTGPTNPNFRAVVAQLVDYGSHLWGMTYEQFEQTVATQYFASASCGVPSLKGLASLDAAARQTWDLSDEEQVTFRDTVSQQLKLGGFHYVAVAQRFTPTVLRTLEYLSATMAHARFYAVEMVRFGGDRVSAFESRTLFKPSPAGRGGERKPSETIDLQSFLNALADESYRQEVAAFLEFCAGQGLTFTWRTVGLSVRVVPVGGKPVSIAWIDDPDKVGGTRVSSARFGYDTWWLKDLPHLERPLHGYYEELSRISGAENITKGKVFVRGFRPELFVQSVRDISAAISRLVTVISQSQSQ